MIESIKYFRIQWAGNEADNDIYKVVFYDKQKDFITQSIIYGKEQIKGYLQCLYDFDLQFLRKREIQYD